jgi:hypothetical protein
LKVDPRREAETIVTNRKAAVRAVFLEGLASLSLTSIMTGILPYNRMSTV